MAVLAIDIGGTKIAAALVTRRGDLRHRLEEPTDASAPLAPVEQIAAIARRLPRVDALGIADLVIDNCVPAQDSLVDVEGWAAPVAAGSTVAFVTIAMAIVAELAPELARRGINPPVFVSPNVPGIAADNNLQVFAAYERALRRE